MTTVVRLHRAALYYDSFENQGNWAPELPAAFASLRGYALEEHLDAFDGSAEADRARRVLCDYRQTLSDLLLECVTYIAEWGEHRGIGLRMQAHGAPANLLDMYALASIPETEVFGANHFAIPGFRREPRWCRPDRHSALVNRFASSAAHVAGRALVVSESFTWLRNHYHTALSHIKAETDLLLLNGINGVFYHGTCFSPKETEWPGWLFYASTQANARNSIFRDIPALNAYITRCQSVLQDGQPHNDLLLFWPIDDLWMAGGNRERRFSVHDASWLEGTSCGDAAQWMIDQGFSFDFVSDQQLQGLSVQDGALQTASGTSYETILVPAARCMRVATAERLVELAREGATVLVWRQLPEEVPGWHEHAQRAVELQTILGALALQDGAAKIGRGRILLGEDLAQLLATAEIARESLVDHDLQYIRRRQPGQVTYFLVNHSAKPVNGWIRVNAPCRSALLMDPMTGRTGKARTDGPPNRSRHYLQMEPGETRVLRVFASQNVEHDFWPVLQPVGDPQSIRGTWQVEFVEGGPVLPNRFSTDQLRSWTEVGGDEAKRFAGDLRYTNTFDLSTQNADHWFLDLGDVRESARVWVNGQAAGIIIAHPFRVDISAHVRPGKNLLEIEVTNLSTNRIRDLDLRHVNWKKFYDTNLVTQMYKPFDASDWDLKPSGLLGPIRLVPMKNMSTMPR